MYKKSEKTTKRKGNFKRKSVCLVGFKFNPKMIALLHCKELPFNKVSPTGL